MKDIIKRFKETWELSKQDIENLKNERIINWIWPKGLSFEPILESIKSLPYFDSDRYQELYEDIQYISYKHDFEFYIGWSYWDFTTSNFKFAINLYKLLYWTKWYKKAGISIFVFIVLEIYWKKYFNFKKNNYKKKRFK